MTSALPPARPGAAPRLRGGAAGHAPRVSDPQDMTDDEQQVFAALSALEADGGPAPFATDVARQASVETDVARNALSGLAARGLVTRLDDTESGTEDLGPRWTSSGR